jgi:hypothetical protein
MPIHTGPCEPWPLDPSCCPALEDADEATITRWSKVATQTLWRLSGMRWGPSCPLVVRPCKKSCLDSYPLNVNWFGGSPWIPYIGADGQWRNASVCGCKADCGCGSLEEVRLDGPVHDIVSVQIGTETLDPMSYRVDNGSRLVRTDGGEWPDCQNLAGACGDEGAFCVTYRTGLPLDEAAIAAYSAYVCHLVKGCSTSCGCGLSARQNLSRVQRQGVTLEMNQLRDSQGHFIYDEGRTGIAEVDVWLAAVNPYRLTSPSRVLSPDYKQQRVTTWP